MITDLFNDSLISTFPLITNKCTGSLQAMMTVNNAIWWRRVI